jgi:L-ascorbate metabolism protein UlaG (beta-lactamase superfamily)
MAEVWYLGHSGFAVGINEYLLVFDYYLDTCRQKERSLSTGVINPDEIKNRKILFFSSHSHQDHFNPVILSWRKNLPHSEYYLSYDIPGKYHTEWTNILKPHQVWESKYRINNQPIKIQTFESTDEGVAFLVTMDNIVIYHAGDLNWWHWDEEPETWNSNMAGNFKKEVSLIKKHPIDIAFITTDPRQEEAWLWGAAWFLENVDVKTAFPMHFWEDYSISGKINKESENYPALKKLKSITKRGQHFIIPL